MRLEESKWESSDAGKSAVWGREIRRNTVYSSVFPYSEDVNLEAEGVSEAAGQCAALQMGRKRDFRVRFQYNALH